MHTLVVLIVSDIVPLWATVPARRHEASAEGDQNKSEVTWNRGQVPVHLALLEGEASHSGEDGAGKTARATS